MSATARGRCGGWDKVCHAGLDYQRSRLGQSGRSTGIGGRHFRPPGAGIDPISRMTKPHAGFPNDGFFLIAYRGIVSPAAQAGHDPFFDLPQPISKCFAVIVRRNFDQRETRLVRSALGSAPNRAIEGLFLLQRPLDFAFANREFPAYFPGNLPASSRLFSRRNLLYVERAGRKLELPPRP
jgi:hypothetical protein